MYSPARRSILFVAALAMLSLRALTPDGYMPATMGSGLLFELCPDGIPDAFMQALGGGHHHHHGGQDSASDSGSEQCPIGHMLASALASDVDTTTDVAPVVTLPPAYSPAGTWRQRTAVYQSRAPPG
jgi:hypothetical protein